jgi:hypothetical protein
MPEWSASRQLVLACPNPKVKERLVLTSFRTRGILVALDILVDIGVFAEKEVIQWGTVYVEAVEEALVRLPSASLLLSRLSDSLLIDEFIQRLSGTRICGL